jgi:hypothetical protein
MIVLHILNWTEIWATMIPIVVWIFRKSTSEILKPIKIWLIITLLISIWEDLANFNLIDNNHFLYTINSVCSLVFFLWFFYILKVTDNNKVPLIFCAVTVIVVILNFIFFESFITTFSSRIFSLEAFVLLIFCAIYFFKELKSSEISSTLVYSLPVVVGLSIYEATCFPVFLFYKTLIQQEEIYAAYIWNFAHNIVYIVFCIFLAKAFYGNSRLTHK